MADVPSNFLAVSYYYSDGPCQVDINSHHDSSNWISLYQLKCLNEATDFLEIWLGVAVFCEVFPWPHIIYSHSRKGAQTLVCHELIIKLLSKAIRYCSFATSKTNPNHEIATSAAFLAPFIAGQLILELHLGITVVMAERQTEIMILWQDSACPTARNSNTIHFGEIELLPSDLSFRHEPISLLYQCFISLLWCPLWDTQIFHVYCPSHCWQGVSHKKQHSSSQVPNINKTVTRLYFTMKSWIESRIIGKVQTAQWRLRNWTEWNACSPETHIIYTQCLSNDIPGIGYTLT